MLGYHIRIHLVLASINLLISIVGCLDEPVDNVNNDCNLNYNVDKFFADIDGIEEKYAGARNAFHEQVGGKEFDDKMMQELLSQGGAAVRTVYDHSQTHSSIPAGISLGGHVIMRLKETVLMFYRMILRNNTVFQLVSLQNNFTDMTLNAELKLNELHLFGTFSSCLRRRKSQEANDYFLNCQHKFGQVEILLSNTRYKLQGRYRIVQDKLKLEYVASKLDIGHVGWSRSDNNNIQEDTQWRSNLDEFILRLQSDLDRWMLDYFNDYLMYYVEFGNSPEVYNFQQYDGARTKIANDFVDNTIDVLNNRLRDMQQTCVKIPDYALSPSTKMTMLELVQGQLIGLESMYRRSVATVSPGENREVNAVVEFSNMKVFYSYELVRNKYPYKGLIVLTADDVAAQLSIKLNKSYRRKDSKQVAVELKILKVAKSNFMTVRGVGVLPALKSLLENQIKTIMGENIVNAIKNLGAAARCEPTILVKPFTFDINSNNTLSDDEHEEDS